jgi:isoleucyl-tRNA synthetase/very-short-patch-repair endonuclease
MKFAEYKNFDLSQINKDVLKSWQEGKVFEKSIDQREGCPSFIFYEGPPSANGIPGIHHVMARTIKDIFCRYKTMKGFQVKRKAGWDTHGLPVELGVEKALGITKEDIGKKISVEEYNKACRTDVMKYTREWEDLTQIMGYWVDMTDPYITYDNQYIESLWYLLKQLYNKGLLYKGYTIQPYSPAAGTGLSTHELNQPGCYKDVKDTTVVAQFKVKEKEKLLDDCDQKFDLFFLAWTTTPWTLPSNTALAVGANIEYFKVKTINPYTKKPVIVIVAKDLFSNFFIVPKEINGKPLFPDFNKSAEIIDIVPNGDYNNFNILDINKIRYWEIIGVCKGSELNNIKYEQLLPYQQPNNGDAFRVLIGDFVTTEDGTGIVHIAPSFGADDFRVAKQNGIGSLTLVDKQGKFIEGCGDISGRFVKNAYDPKLSEDDETVDLFIALKLKADNKAFRIEKYIHTYPHCWRTDKPVLYYPLDSWFVKTTALRDRMIELNNTINWKPESTGSGRFGKWLENLQDWNLSRSRYWGTPLPIWRTEDASEEICIGTVEELKNEIEKSVKAGLMKSNPLATFKPGDESKNNYLNFDLHKPFVDDIILVSQSGKPMHRENDLIDVWFDSGAMPYAQVHYLGNTAPSSSPQGGEKEASSLTSTKGEGEKSAPKYQTARASMYPLLKKLADDKKKNQTQSEGVLWECLRGKQLENYKFRRQHLIDEFIVDFVCLEKQLIIEVDGGYHNQPDVQKADALRTEILESLCYRVIRFTNEEVLSNIDYVLNRIKLALEALPIPSVKNLISKVSSPLPLGEGRGGASLFPADFIAEGVDQTRGWFFTLHAIATMLFDSVAFKNIISNGLVLDKNGNKMSKRLGNAVDPFTTIEKYGSDPLRWYMITNASPWDNLKFDIAGVEEVMRKFFGTLHNTYSFFALYANVDGFAYKEAEIPINERPEIDRWIISLLNSLIKEVDECYADYEPTKAGRAIANFVGENLSNWYVRLNRKRFWGGEFSKDKIAAYQTLYTCIDVVAKLASPIAPFYTEKIFTDLNVTTGLNKSGSVHLSSFPKINEKNIDKKLEERMDIAQQVSSMVLSLRRKVNIKVRQPLQKIMIPILDESLVTQFEAVKNLILSEVNVKEVEYLKDTKGFLVKKIKPNFKTLGPRYGKLMKQISNAVVSFSQDDIFNFESKNGCTLIVEGQKVELFNEDVEITSEDIPGWLVASEGRLTVALDIKVTEELRQEGIAREFINRIQNLRKDSDFDVTDKILIEIQKHEAINDAIEIHKEYISAQTLAIELSLVENIKNNGSKLVDIDEEIQTLIRIERKKEK